MMLLILVGGGLEMTENEDVREVLIGVDKFGMAGDETLDWGYTLPFV